MTLSCPYCRLKFRMLAATDSGIDYTTVAALVCERCIIVSLLDKGVVRKITQPELEALKQSPSWPIVTKMIEVIAKVRMRYAIDPDWEDV